MPIETPVKTPTKTSIKTPIETSIKTPIQSEWHEHSRALRGGCVFTLGTFDGLHAAHARLLERAKRVARLRGRPLVVMTFRKNPLEVLCPAKAPRALMTASEKLAALSALGVDETIVCEFNEEFAETEPEELIEAVARRYHPTDWFVGFNNTFGRGGTGTPSTLMRMGGAIGFKTHVMPPMTRAGETVSSSRVRAALISGDLKLAQALLGRCYTIRGYVSGAGVLTVSDRLLMPAAGSYSVLMDAIGSNRSAAAAAQNPDQREYTLRLIPSRIGPPSPPTDAMAPVGRILLAANQTIPSGIKRLSFVGRLEAQTGARP
jgi:riboflavin kinase/FMN adenylyltransferase